MPRRPAEVMQVEHRQCNAGTAKFKVSWRPLGPVPESQKSFRRHGGLAETFWNTEILDIASRSCSFESAMGET